MAFVWFGSQIIDSLSRRLETNARRKKEEQKKVALVAKIFAVTRIRLIWFDIFEEQVNCEKKRYNCQFPTTTKEFYGQTYHR